MKILSRESQNLNAPPLLKIQNKKHLKANINITSISHVIICRTLFKTKFIILRDHILVLCHGIILLLWERLFIGGNPLFLNGIVCWFCLSSVHAVKNESLQKEKWEKADFELREGGEDQNYFNELINFGQMKQNEE